MIHRLSSLMTEGAQIASLEATHLSATGRPAPIVDREPRENFDLGWKAVLENKTS